MTPLPNTLSGIMALFESLPPATTIPDNTRFLGQSIGPTWLIAMGWPLLNFGTLAGWKGKQFHDNGRVLNLVERKGIESEIVPIQASIADYSKHSGAVVNLSYPSDTTFPWNKVTDELRPLPDGRFLGVTTVDLPLIKALPYPFVLTPD
jgi:hypothetical protein